MPHLSVSDRPTAYLSFTRQQWRDFRSNMPLTLTADDLHELHGQMEVVSLTEVTEIYLPLSRLLSLYVTAKQALYRVLNEFTGTTSLPAPYIIGIAGSVAVGKSTCSRVLQALLSRWSHHPRVEIITTDGFLYPNQALQERHLMQRKGFPESYRLQHLLSVLNDIKSGKRNVPIPLYSHHTYDVLPHQVKTIDQPDIVIVEGLNILQTDFKNASKVFVSDFFDFSLFVHAEPDIIKGWYVDRVLQFCEGPFRDSKAYFHYLTKMNREEIIQFANKIWKEINEVNLLNNILPYRYRAQLILEKMKDHSVQRVFLRKW
ncbi:MAG: type I pantothenate kinase [Coxiella sp. RIFCSPHIGHO2_12_FULL_44_14]|nr:MAG: type I pantothenate kinase [Coxiella sp. RIFCSPHIGHO2_12_FULL_44_14]